MPYEVNDGRILTWSLEAHVVEHCNLRCRGCCQLSPDLDEAFLAPEVLARDLARAATVLRPTVFKLTGGEPLLHPRIVDLLAIARASRISQRVQVTTNGLLLPTMPDAFYASLDRLKISIYPSGSPSGSVPARTLDLAAERCARHGVELSVRRYDSFQSLDPDDPREDDARAAASWPGCWLRARCHLVHHGRFYPCSRPPHLEIHLRRLGVPVAPLALDDGVALDGPLLLERILDRLESGPLAACRHCLGSSGPWRPHEQVPLRRLPLARTAPA